MRVINVVGARPNFMKVASLMEAYANIEAIDPVLVHTGQHYDANMNAQFFRELGIPEPDINLGVGSGSHAVQTAGIMTAFEPTLEDARADAVVVVGDVNSTIACGLVAVKLGVPLVHVEAGLRSFDRKMPEEVNRVLTDAISDLLFCTERSGVENLRREGVDEQRVHLVGNLMIDTLVRHRQRAADSTILDDLALASGSYAAITLHRPSNVDDPAALANAVAIIERIASDMPVVFPVHPRTRYQLERHGLASRLDQHPKVSLLEPLGYLDFLRLLSDARVILTDSGGIQEESTILGVACLTLRENTERPVTVEVGCNRIVGTEPARVISAYEQVLEAGPRDYPAPPLWDGQAGRRIARVLAASF